MYLLLHCCLDPRLRTNDLKTCEIVRKYGNKCFVDEQNAALISSQYEVPPNSLIHSGHGHFISTSSEKQIVNNRFSFFVEYLPLLHLQIIIFYLFWIFVILSLLGNELYIFVLFFLSFIISFYLLLYKLCYLLSVIK